MEVKSNIGDVAKDTDKLTKSSEKASKGVGKIGTAFKGMGTAIKAAGIGLVVALLAKLMEVFSKNQKVLDVFNAAMTALGIAFNDLFGFLENNIGTITGYFKELFTNPVEKIKELGDAIKEGFIDRFEQALEVLGLVAKSFGQLIDGEFSEAFDTIKEAGKETVDVFTGVDDSFDKVADTIVKYTTETLKQADAITQTAKAADRAAVQFAMLNAQYLKDAEVQRQIRDDESKSIEDRIKANEELALVLDEQEKAMKENAAIAVASAEAELSKNKDNIQLQKAYQEALNEQAAIEAQITGFRSEQQTNTNSLLKEQKEIMNEIALFGKSERDKERFINSFGRIIYNHNI